MQRDSARLAPVLTFNRKDQLQSQFLLEHFGLSDNAFPRHYIPATSPYNHAIALGLGWGMIPELMLQEMPGDSGLVRLAPAHPVDVTCTGIAGKCNRHVLRACLRSWSKQRDMPCAEEHERLSAHDDAYVKLLPSAVNKRTHGYTWAQRLHRTIMTTAIHQLFPQPLWQWFEQICAIPHLPNTKPHSANLSSNGQNSAVCQWWSIMSATSSSANQPPLAWKTVKQS
jgi:hypothetical protein